MDVEGSRRCGFGGERDAEEHVPAISTEETERSKNGSSKDQEESTSRTLGSESCPSEPLKDSYARARGR